MIGSGGIEIDEIDAQGNVSILVVLDDWFGPSARTESRLIVGFQSLLFWMIGSGNGMTIAAIGFQLSFNPCCFG